MSGNPVDAVSNAIAKSKRGNFAKKVAKAPTPSNSKMNPALQAAIARRMGGGAKSKPAASGPASYNELG